MQDSSGDRLLAVILYGSQPRAVTGSDARFPYDSRRRSSSSSSSKFLARSCKRLNIYPRGRGTEHWTCRLLVPMLWSARSARVSGSAVSLSGPARGCPALREDVPLEQHALRAQGFRGCTAPPWSPSLTPGGLGRAFLIFLLFKLLSLALCTSFTICFRKIFLQWKFSFGPCLPFSMFLLYGVGTSLASSQYFLHSPSRSGLSP